MLFFKIGAQECMREPHARRDIGLRLAAIEARPRKAQRPVQHGRQQRKQDERNGQLDQRETMVSILHSGFLAPSLNVDSETMRSPPLSLGNRTSAVTRKRRVGRASDARSRSSVVLGGV